MAAGIARLETERVIVRMRLEGVVRVCGETVVVLGMVVVRVLVVWSADTGPANDAKAAPSRIAVRRRTGPSVCNPDLRVNQAPA